MTNIFYRLLIEEFSGLTKIEKAAMGTSNFGLDDSQIQNDLSAINRIIQHSYKTSSPPSANVQSQSEVLM